MPDPILYNACLDLYLLPSTTHKGTHMLIKEGNVAYDDFDPSTLTRARFAWNQSKRAAGLAVQAMRRFDLPANATLIREWFGLSPKTNPAHAQKLMQVQSNLTEMERAYASRPITLVWAPNIVVKHAPADRNLPMTPVQLAGGTAFTGQNVYGYVHQHLAGSGMRVILGRWFRDDPDPQEATQTIYHEITHKVLKTADHCYGVDLCRRLATNNITQATTNADNYGYFAKSMVGKV